MTGAGTIQLNIPYLREYVRGDWSGFSGRLIANGVGTDKRGSLLLLDKTPKLDNTIIDLRGNANLCYWGTNGNLAIGGLSGTSATYLNGSSKQTDGFAFTWTVGSANSDETFAGRINNWSVSGSGHVGTVSIVKVGTGQWRLTGSNDYKGTTTVSAGTLTVNGTNSGTGAVTVAADATLAGKGTIAGQVTIQKGGTLQVGDEGATDKGLTLSGGLKLSSGAILRLNDAMLGRSYGSGSQIQAFTGSAGGTFAEIIPATPGDGLSWDTSELYTNGVLKVIGEGDSPVTPDPVEPELDKKTAMLSMDNMTLGCYPGTDVNNMLTGSGSADGFSMVLTGNLTKTYSNGQKISVKYDGTTSAMTTIKTSNGAMNTIYVPEGYVATKLTLWSYTNKSDTDRINFWSSVGGVSYTAETTTVLGINNAATPDCVSFDLDYLTEIEFKNSGYQQCVVAIVDYQQLIVGDTDGNAKVDADDVAALAAHLVGNTPQGFILKAADLTGDGKVDITDLTRLVETVIGGE